MARQFRITQDFTGMGFAGALMFVFGPPAAAFGFWNESFAFSIIAGLATSASIPMMLIGRQQIVRTERVPDRLPDLAAEARPPLKERRLA